MSASKVLYWDPVQGNAASAELDRFASAHQGLVLAIGIFDGLHIGHRALLTDAMKNAAELGCAFAVVTFAQDPDEVFHADTHFRLCANEHRIEMLAEYCNSTVVVLPASREVFGMQPDEFLDALAAEFKPAAVHVGENFHFGFKASGTPADIERWGATHACVCHPHALVEAEGGVVSSTRIRSLLVEGHVSQAAHLLGGRHHSLHGTVTRGRGEGAGFGFATANLDLSQNQVMLPCEGVYGGYADVEGVRYPAAINMGRAISFQEATAPLEAHLLGFEGNLYGKEVEVSFVEWLRAPRVFKSKDELISTVMGNIDWVRQNLGDGPLG